MTGMFHLRLFRVGQLTETRGRQPRAPGMDDGDPEWRTVKRLGRSREALERCMSCHVVLSCCKGVYKML